MAVNAPPADVTEAPPPPLPRWRRAGPPWLLTREELVDELQHAQIDVSGRQIQRWVSAGVLPKPIRQVPRSGPGNKAKALYPQWLLYVLFDLHHQAPPGATMAELKQVANQSIHTWRDDADVLNLNQQIATRPPEVLPDRIPQYVREALWRYADQFSAPGQTLVQQIRVNLLTTAGPDIHLIVKRPRPRDADV